MGTHPIFESDFDCLTDFEMEQSFASPDEAVQYWRQLAAERKDDFDELKEMGEELEQEQERTIGQLESDNKRLRSDVDKYKEQLEQNRETQRERDREREDELQRVKQRLESTEAEKMELTTAVRKLEQLLDDAERSQRQLEATYEGTAELLRIETERNALLETELLDGESLKEMFQRQKDENRDLKSELAYRERKIKELDTMQRSSVSMNGNTPSTSENDKSGSVSNPKTPSTPTSTPPPITATIAHPSPHAAAISPTTSKPVQMVSPTSTSSQLIRPKLTHSNSTGSSTSSSSRMSALSIVGDLLKKVGALETKLASCRTFVRDNAPELDAQGKVRTPLRNNYRQNIPFTPSKKSIDISINNETPEKVDPQSVTRSSRDRTQ